MTLFLRFSQKQTQDIPISGNMLVKKAKIFNHGLNYIVNFNAGSGWVHCIKALHGICKLPVLGEKMNQDSEEVAEI